MVGPTSTLSDRSAAPATPAGLSGDVRSRATPRWLPWLLLVSGLCCVAAAVVLVALGWAPAPTPPHLGVVPRAEAGPARPVGSPAASVSPTPAPSPTAAPPTRVALPMLGIDAPVVPVAVLPGGGLAIPADPKTVGWWRGGSAPGSSDGTVVLAGHVDTARDGPGALFALSRAVPGQHVVLTAGQKPRDYVISGVRGYRKADLPSEVFATTGQPRLVLITCGGAFDPTTKQYAENLVVYALPD